MTRDAADIVVGDDVVTVCAHGEFDLLSAGTLVVALRKASTHHKDIVLDLSDVSLVDAVTLQMIADARDRIRARGHELTVTNAPALVRRLAHVLRVDDLVGGDGHPRPARG
jgi:anti-anti-sigma factor